MPGTNRRERIPGFFDRQIVNKPRAGVILTRTLPLS